MNRRDYPWIAGPVQQQVVPGLDVYYAKSYVLIGDELKHTTRRGPQTVPELLAWIDGACDWKQHRRRGFDYPLLLPPKAASDPSENAASIYPAIAMRATFAQDAQAVRGFFDALVGLFTGDGVAVAAESGRAGHRRRHHSALGVGLILHSRPRCCEP